MICKRCGAASKDGSIFCTGCGAPLSAPEIQIVPEPVPEAAPPIQPGAVCTQCGKGLIPGRSFCIYCGAPTAQQPIQPIVPAPIQPTAPVPQASVAVATSKPKRKRSAPGPVARVFLRLLSFLLCLCLFTALLATALVLDVRHLTDADNLQKMVGSVLSPEAQPQRRPTVAAAGIQISGEDLDSASMDGLLDLIYQEMEAHYGAELDATPEQLEEFYERSTAKDYLSEKISSYLSDLINGTDHTQITSQEVTDLVNENADLIGSIFGVSVDGEIRQKVADFVDDADLGSVIRKEVIGAIAQTQIGTDGPTVEELLATLARYTSSTALWTLIAIDILLIVLLFFTNWLRVPATLRCVGIPTVTAGALLSLPTLLLQLLSGATGTFLSGLTRSLASLLAPVHYGILLIGVVLLIAGIVAGIITRAAAE